MKRISRLCIALLFSTMLSASTFAETIGFPKDKPVFTIEVPLGLRSGLQPDADLFSWLMPS